MKSHAPQTAKSASPLCVTLESDTLLVRLPAPWPVLSWAPHNGGLTRTACVFNHRKGKFADEELAGIFAEVKRAFDLPNDAVGLLTGADIERYRESVLTHGPLWVHAVATAGLHNLRAAGDPADAPLDSREPGTINLILATNALPGIDGMTEAVHTAGMAKTAVLIEAGKVSPKTGRPATGTGTDCIVIAASGDVPENLCGMHTVLGELIGNAVRQAVAEAIAAPSTPIAGQKKSPPGSGGDFSSLRGAP